jgi:hypothetical protein
MYKQTLKHKWHFTFALIVMVCVLASLTLTRPQQATAYMLRSDRPERKAVISVSFTTYEWWLLTWSRNQLICQMYIEHDGWPTPEEVKFYCGDQILKDWLETTPCLFSDEVTEAAHCPGFYLHLANVTPGEREIEVDLLPPQVFVDIADCPLDPSKYWCDSLPSLHLTAKEPLPNESIINIQGFIGAESFSCKGSECTVPLPVTGTGGIEVTFWADSSFGDSSETFSAKIRVIPKGDMVAPDGQTPENAQWYVNILSRQYLGNINSTCSQIWSSFPPVEGPPAWLSSPDHPDGLISSQPYYYLAGSLIRQGLVDVSECVDGGLQSSWVANQCGLEASRYLINQWQNLFNSEIIQVANDTGVPAQLMKNIFSRESQFWPGFSASYQEAGLGHMSDLGADTVLLWNPNFFSQFCPLILDTNICHRGFGNLDSAEQEMLRGALVQQVDAACPECPLGIDLRQANFSISIFARSILANCEQVNQIIYNETQQSAGEVSHYEDLWRFTLVNYNAGPGCLSDAIQQTIANNYPLTWENMIQFLEPGGCQVSIQYVEDIFQMPVSPVVTATPTQPPEDPVQPTPTPADNGYPAP